MPASSSSTIKAAIQASGIPTTVETRFATNEILRERPSGSTKTLRAITASINTIGTKRIQLAGQTYRSIGMPTSAKTLEGQSANPTAAAAPAEMRRCGPFSGVCTGSFSVSRNCRRLLLNLLPGRGLLQRWRLVVFLEGIALGAVQFLVSVIYHFPMIGSQESRELTDGRKLEIEGLAGDQEEDLANIVRLLDF